MKKKNILICAALVLALSSLGAAGCAKKAEEESTSAQSSTAEESSAKETQESSTEAEQNKDKKVEGVELNFDVANHVGGDYDSILLELGAPAEEKKDEISSILYYKDPDRMFVLYPEQGEADEAGLCWVVTTTMGDLWGIGKEEIKSEDFLNSLSAEDVSYNKNVDESEFTIGKKDQETLEFVSEGYMFIIALNEGRTLNADSPVGIYSLDVLPVN
ncbi:MAG: hypothetical protein Q4A19_00930 [Johnsonella sp.]|nr:hypothetical protein [Johnsonella sp.]